MKPFITPYQQGSQSGPVNRATEMRRDTDTVKTPKVSLYDLDFSVYHHLSETLQLQVMNNGVSQKIPVLYSSAEKWSQIRAEGFMRDNQRKILCPAILIRRTNVANDERIYMPVGNLTPPRVKIIPYKQMNMQYDRVAGQYLSKESQEYYLADIPVYVRVSYELILWTDYIEQMNDLVQTILTTSDDIWGDFYKFRVKVTDTTHETLNVPGEDRIVKPTMTLQLDGYLRSEYAYHEATMVKNYTVKRVDFINEGTEEILFDNPEQINAPGDNFPYFSDPAPMQSEEIYKRNLRKGQL